MDQMELLSENLDQPIPNIQVTMADHVVNNQLSPHFVASNQQMESLEPISTHSMSYDLNYSGKPFVSVESKDSNLLPRPFVSMDTKDCNLLPQPFLVPNQQFVRMDTMLSSLGSQKMFLPTKRKVESENVVNGSAPGHVPRKRMSPMETLANSPGPMLQPPIFKRVQPMQCVSGAPSPQNISMPNKKMARHESVAGKSGAQRVQNPKNKTLPMEQSPKVQKETFEAVRSKMRESLADALALACQHQEKSSSEGKISQNEIASNSPLDNSHSAGLASIPVESRNSMHGLCSTEAPVMDKLHDEVAESINVSTDEGMGSSTQKCDGPESQCNIFLPDEDVSFSDNFFVKDELLQGNGLSWALEFDTGVVEAKEIQASDKPTLLQNDVGHGEQAVVNPHKLALKIEAELFKLFGGVNKKYKEKGRSLLFNLKDRNNPELRERVVSGEITPERLCSMTAEELASKELSEWRMAKAEELAQMVVLPDSDLNMRRLVKKTHKGEYQVDFVRDDDVSVEVSVGTSLSQIGSKSKAKGRQTSTKTNNNISKNSGDGSSLNNKNVPYSLTIPNDGADLMQGLMVDEFKDADLPPIVSLDEFMESLDSEPPFQDLTVDARQGNPLSGKERPDAGHNVVDSQSRIFPGDAADSSSKKVVKVDMKNTKLDVNEKPCDSPAEPKANIKKTLHQDALKVENIWEGVVQLNISSPVTVVGLYRSGEKASTKEWPSSLEIKGRVRLDAFEKFVQDLPMSRSRSVMVVSFVLKNEASDDERACLGEVVNSYVLDERLGFAEPVVGVEVYFCPPHAKVIGMLTKHLCKDQTEILNTSDNGLIGVVVWRKAHLTSTISPNSSSHHKHSLKKQHTTPPGRRQDKDSNVNVNLTSKASVSLPRANPGPIADDDDDVPPGFGPVASRDDDDLPEFTFSGAVKPSSSRHSTHNPSQPSRIKPMYTPHISSRPVDQVRELIQKYGQTDSNVTSRNWQDNRDASLGLQPWNDDDDDIPEWQPQAPQSHIQSNTSMHGYHQSLQTPHLSSQVAPAMTMPTRHQGAPNVHPSWQRDPRWVNQPVPQPSSLGIHPNTGRQDNMTALQAGQPGINWRRNPPSRGL